MTDWKLHHIAVIVKDIDKAVEYYQSLGIARPGREVEFPEAKPAIRARFVDIGSTPVEFIQPLEGESHYKDFLESQGEGVQHIAFAVDDLDAETERLTAQGVSIIIKGQAPAAFGSRTAHFDTRQVGNFAIQLIQEADG